MMTPPICPRRARASNDADGAFPSILTTSFWPTSWLRVGAVATPAGAAEPGGIPAPLVIRDK